MPKTWAETDVRLSDQLRATIPDADRTVLRDLALDFLNHPEAWRPVDQRQRCLFLGSDGSPVRVDIGVATIDSESATVFAVQLKDACLADLSRPLTRVEEFENDYVDVDYRSKPVASRPMLKVRLGEVRRLQPMKYDPEE